MKQLVFPFGVLTLALSTLACGGAGTAGTESASAGPGAGGGTGGDDGSPTGSGGNGTAAVTVTSGSSTTTGGGVVCDSADDEDRDADGWTRTAGDCNDCDANVNPDAIEVVVTEPDPETGEVPEAADEDCDGSVDVVLPTCDTGLALDSGAALDGAKAIDLCKEAPAAPGGPGNGGWGVIGARWTKANGTEVPNPGAKVGLLESFGANVAPRAGERILGVSSGKARLPGQPGACNAADCAEGGSGSPPPGFPASVPGCGGGAGSAINDDIALEVRLRAPTNATGYSFDFKFYSFEFSEWVCTPYNDQFVAIVDPPPQGAVNGNISFDNVGNPVSVNIAFFDVCASCAGFAAWCDCEPGSSCPSPPANCCAAGAAELAGTGFDQWDSPNKGLPDDFGFCSLGGPAPVTGGGTTWLRTTAPVQGGTEFTIRLAIWDSTDQLLDSTAVIDNFKWVATGGTVEVGTTPVPPGPN